jgi:anti-anti-sigma factor
MTRGERRIYSADGRLMELTYSDLGDGVRRIDLAGRLDVEGAEAIELRFTALTATHQSYVIVDLSGVAFLASMGIATLVRNARAVRLRGGNLVLLSPRPNVAQVLASTRIDQMLSVFPTFEEALAAVRIVPPPRM